MSNIEEIKSLVDSKHLAKNEAAIATGCMIELCEQCGTKKKLAKLGSLFENLTEGIIVFDLELNVIDKNKIGQSILEDFKSFYYDGKSYKLKGLPITSAVLINNSPSSNVEIESFDELGRKHIFTAGASPIFSERSVKVGICLIISDITEVQKQARQIEDMVSALTHDLKTPLVAAETSIKHLLDGYFGALSKDQIEILSLLNQSNSDALRLVKNLLAVFKYETKSYKLLLELVDISKLLEKVLSSTKVMIEEKEIHLRIVPSNFQIMCDPFEIERVIVNLITNSIKYTPSGGRIEIRAVKNEQGTAIITVEDNGKGISKEDLPNLFERFWQTKKSEDKANSTGLGLYLSRQIIESHGGKIWAVSELGKGTKVTFEIPEIVL